MILLRTLLLLPLASLVALAATPRTQGVREPAQTLPVAAEVDVLVVGGTSGGVAAAVAAAQSGASVFLTTARPYLGEDLCGTYRIWLEAGEEPQSELAQALFAKSAVATGFENALRFQYVTEPPSSPPHQEPPGARWLNDGKWHSAPQQSVQYNGNATITLDLGSSQSVSRVHVLVYQRDRDFEVQSVSLLKSDDLRNWTPIGEVQNSQLGDGSYEQVAIPLTLPVDAEVRYLRVEARKGAESNRVLLGEIIVQGPTLDPAQPDTSRWRVFTPMQIKHRLDNALLEAGIPFLYGCYATEMLLDSQGNPAGVLIDNNSGRQAIRAKVIIDATPSASVTRLTSAEFAHYPRAPQTFRRVVIGGEPRLDSELQIIPPGDEPITFIGAGGQRHALIQYEFTLPMGSRSFATLARAEQIARDLTWTPEQVDSSEVLFQVPPDPIRAKRSLDGPWPGANSLPIDAFRPQGVSRLFVLNGCADLSREAAASLLRPLNYLTAGRLVGIHAARESQTITSEQKLAPPRRAYRPHPTAEARSPLPDTWPRQLNAPSITLGEQIVPVIGTYDVVVVGGGTGGAPAAIGAGRQGARTLLIEYLHGLGGVGTLGLISTYYHGNRVGFTAEVDQGVAQMDGQERGPAHSWNVEWKMEWYRQALREAYVDIWFGTLGCGAVVDDNRVIGVVVATPEGRGVVLAKTVVDSTGNAAVAAAAGAPCTYTDGSHIAVQGTGLPPRELGAKYVNTDYTFVDETDVADLWRVQVMAREKFKDAYDLGQLVDTRERRQIIGDMTLTPLDMMNRRTHPDTIVISVSNFDTHGFTVHPMFMLRPPDREDVAVHVPYRCLLPKGIDGILVTGLGVSAHRDAMPVIRMQADIQNQGYAAGVAAATLADQGLSTRQLDVKKLQQHLVAKAILPESVLTDTDSFPLPDEAIADAVQSVRYEYQGLEALLTRPDVALPLLRETYSQTELFTDKLVYAHVLGMFGDDTGVDTLLAKVRATAWDEGWDYTGMGQFGASLSPLDSHIIALGRSKDARALEPLLDKLEDLDTDSAFSHFRALAIALESLGDPRAAPALAQVLRRPGIGGHAVTSINSATDDIPASRTDTTTRNRALKELVLARALFRCGDHQGLGRNTLLEYSRDLHGHYARHAHAVLNEH